MGCSCEHLMLTWVVTVLILIVKYYMQGGKYCKKTSAEGKVIVITGANTGIGKETARDLARRGAIIYMACRDMQKCEQARQEIIAETGNTQIYGMKLDLASLKSIKEFAENYCKAQNRLDILINNAAIMHCPLMHTEDGFEMQLGVNHIGHVYLTSLLLDLLKQSAPSRILMLSSFAHNFGKINKDDLMSGKHYSRSRAYQQSKLANILYARELAKRLNDTKVTVNAVHPGFVDSELMRHIPIFKYSFTSYFANIVVWPFIKTTKSGAQTTIYAALDPDLNDVSGEYFCDCKPKNVAKAAKDDEMAKWLWNETDRLIKLKLIQLGLK